MKQLNFEDKGRQLISNNNFTFEDGDVLYASDINTIANFIGNEEIEEDTLIQEIENIKEKITLLYQYLTIKETIINDDNFIYIDDAIKMYAEKIRGNIVSLQDFNGYSSPWPGGGGKNLFNKAQLESSYSVDLTQIDDGFILKSNVAGNYKRIITTINGNFSGRTIYARANITNSGNNDGCLDIRFMDASGETEVGGTSSRLRLTSSINNNSKIAPEGTEQIQIVCYSTMTYSGNVDDTCTITNFILSLEDTAYEPYSNICPIIGTSNIEVTRVGKNLLQPVAYEKIYKGITWTSTIDNGIRVSGTATDNSYGAQGTPDYFVLFPGTYTLSGIKSNQGVEAYLVSAPISGTNSVINGSLDTGNGGTFTLIETTRCYLQYRVYAGTTVNTIIKLQLEKNSTSTPYEIYNREDITIPLDQAVYGGIVDIIAGTLTITHGVFTVNNAIAADSTGKIFRIANQADAEIVRGTTANIKCDQFNVYNLSDLRKDDIITGICQQQTQFYIKCAGCTTLAETSAWLAKNPITVVYPLAIPIIYNLKKEKILLLEDNNLLYTNLSNFEIQYRKKLNVINTEELSTKIKDIEDNLSALITNFETIYYALNHISSRDLNVISINHRGFNTEAPENTLPAYRLSKQKGFTYVETDISFTSDNVAVLLHDNTIDRTSTGSGNVYDFTYQQLLNYDFGSYKGEKYIGTKIPTLKEFLLLCKQIGLHPFIELKSDGNYTRAQVESIVDMVNVCGMRGKVTYFSFNAAYVEWVRDKDSYAHIGLLRQRPSIDDLNIINNLKTEYNEVFYSVRVIYITDEICSTYAQANIPIILWTVNKKSDILNMNPYISGIISDELNASDILYDAAITQ